MKRILLAAVACLAVLATAQAQSVTTNSPFSYTITITVTPTITSVLPANNGATTAANNAGAVLAPLVCTTNPPGNPCKGPVTLGGADAGKFALTNNGMFPTSLAVGAANIPAGTYNLTASANQ